MDKYCQLSLGHTCEGLSRLRLASEIHLNRDWGQFPGEGSLCCVGRAVGLRTSMHVLIVLSEGSSVTSSPSLLPANPSSILIPPFFLPPFPSSFIYGPVSVKTVYMSMDEVISNSIGNSPVAIPVKNISLFPPIRS